MKLLQIHQTKENQPFCLCKWFSINFSSNIFCRNISRCLFCRDKRDEIYLMME